VLHGARRYIADSPRQIVNGRGFRAELDKLSREMKLKAGPRFRFHVSRRAIDLMPDEAEHLLNIAHEALSNALRHSQARTGKLVLRVSRRVIELEVSDQGVGFDPDNMKREGGGLRNMETRARQI